MAKTLKEISTAYCAKQPHQIDYVLESAPFLARVPFQATSKGLMHFFEKVKSVDAAGFVGIDEALPVADVDTEVESRTLGIMGFKIHGGVDTVKLVTKGGTFAEYLAAKSPKVMTASGMALERKIARLAKVYAARNGRLINAGGIASVKPRAAELLCVKIDVEQVRFNQGLYAVDIRIEIRPVGVEYPHPGIGYARTHFLLRKQQNRTGNPDGERLVVLQPHKLHQIGGNIVGKSGLDCDIVRKGFYLAQRCPAAVIGGC